MPQFGASLTDEAGSVIYDHNVFILQATGEGVEAKLVDPQSQNGIWGFC